jgi:uncharacterized cupin superfamily protein
MSEEKKYVLNVADVKLGWPSHHGEKFDAMLGSIGAVLGFKKLGSMLHSVPPGKRAFPMHRHHGVDEMFFVLSGTGEYRVDGDMFAIRAGDVLAAPAGGPVHQIVNTGNEELRYIGISNLAEYDVVEYPDSGKVYAMAGAHDGNSSSASYVARGRLISADYWDGEKG